MIEEKTPSAPGDPLHDFFGEPIDSYTRAQALADGVLVDVTPWAKGLFKIPVAFTCALWSLIKSVPKPLAASETPEKRTRGLLRDVIQAVACSARKTDRIRVISFLVTEDCARSLELLAVCGPGDTPEPVLTVGFPMDF